MISTQCYSCNQAKLSIYAGGLLFYQALWPVSPRLKSIRRTDGAGQFLIIAYFSSSILMVLVSLAVLTRAKYTPLATPLPVSSRPSQRSLWFPPASFPL